MPIVFLQNPGGISLKSLHHYGQIVQGDGTFRMYDHGSNKNLIKYNSVIPPEYPLQKISVPTYLIHGSQDILTTPEVKLQAIKSKNEMNIF